MCEVELYTALISPVLKRLSLCFGADATMQAHVLAATYPHPKLQSL
jgi:hypothetical protein